jgi:hypothetical protein
VKAAEAAEADAGGTAEAVVAGVAGTAAEVAAGDVEDAAEAVVVAADTAETGNRIFLSVAVVTAIDSRCD